MSAVTLSSPLALPSYIESIRHYWKSHLKPNQTVLAKLVQAILLCLGTIFLYGVYQHRQSQLKAFLASHLVSTASSVRSTPQSICEPSSEATIPKNSPAKPSPPHPAAGLLAEFIRKKLMRSEGHSRVSRDSAAASALLTPPPPLRLNSSTPRRVVDSLERVASPHLPGAQGLQGEPVKSEPNRFRRYETGRQCLFFGTFFREFSLAITSCNWQASFWVASELSYQASKDNRLNCVNNKTSYGSLSIKTGSSLQVEIVQNDVWGSESDIYIERVEEKGKVSFLSQQLGDLYQTQVRNLQEAMAAWQDRTHEGVADIPCRREALDSGPSRVLAVVMPEGEEKARATPEVLNSLYRAYILCLSLAESFVQEGLSTVRLSPLSLNPNLAQEEGLVFFKALRDFQQTYPKSALKIKFCIGGKGDLNSYFYPVGKEMD